MNHLVIYDRYQLLINRIIVSIRKCDQLAENNMNNNFKVLINQFKPIVNRKMFIGRTEMRTNINNIQQKIQI